VVISFTGTDDYLPDLLNATIPAGLGVVNTQVTEAIKLVSDVSARIAADWDTTPISSTGHSLDGGLASLMAVLLQPVRNRLRYGAIPNTPRVLCFRWPSGFRDFWSGFDDLWLYPGRCKQQVDDHSLVTLAGRQQPGGCKARCCSLLDCSQRAVATLTSH
jgi:hypothetical protein